jgi:hypothetical protein
MSCESAEPANVLVDDLYISLLVEKSSSPNWMNSRRTPAMERAATDVITRKLCFDIFAKF